MINTRFLLPSESDKYREWLLKQTPETRAMYFGYAATDDSIIVFFNKMQLDANSHYFLVAEEHNVIVGSVHAALNFEEAEFGIIIDPAYRGQGLADRLLGEITAWCRNRGITDIYMQCLSTNRAVQHLCHKHGMKTTTEHTESSTKTKLAPASVYTLLKEAEFRQRQVWHIFLKNSNIEVYG
jgi:RimJ/RimL family protein N-acetyltransferase